MKDYRISLLADYYGEMLPPRMLGIVRKYYDEDMSLTEIAAEFCITKQAVSEMISRATVLLNEFESKLRMLATHDAVCRAIDECICAIDRNDLNHTVAMLTEIKQII